MKRQQPKPIQWQLCLALTAALLLAIVSGSTALAGTAANTTVRNTATVNYDDTAGNAMTAITASVDVTVTLVPATPTLSAPGDQSTDPATAAVYNYTITSNANGPDTYDLTEDSLVEANISGSSSGFSVNPISLGASTVAAGGTIAAAGTTAITVPSDAAGGGDVNGIAAGETVVINGGVFTVASVTDNGGVGTSTITVNGNGTDTAIAVGDLIGEQRTFDLTVTPGTPTGTATITVNISARDSGAVAGAATDETITTVDVPSLTVRKFVANVSNAVVGGGDTLTVDTTGGAGSITYYTTGVTGAPGETLEYVIEIANAAGSSSATDLVISDPVPAFTTYVADSMRLDPGTGTFANNLDDIDDVDSGETDGTNVYFYAGSGGDASIAGLGNGTGGTLAAGAVTRAAFRVTIDN